MPVLLALVVNLNVLQNGLGWDDENIIPNLSAQGRGWNFFLPDRTGGETRKAAAYYRPVVSISYDLDYRIWGDNLFGFHLSVWLAHALNTLLVFLLARSLIAFSISSNPYSLPPNPKVLFPLLTASLFAVHPAHAEAVAWIAGRNDVLCTTFMLSSVLFYLRFHRTGNRIAFGLSMIGFFLALLTKEAALGLILLFPLYEYMVASPSSARVWGRVAIRLAVPMGIVGIYLWMRAISITLPYGGVSADGFVSGSAILDGIVAFAYYFKMMLFPFPHNPFIAALPQGSLFVFSAMVAVSLFVGGILVAVRRRHVLLGMSLAWTVFMLGPAVMVTVLDLAPAPAAERYVYAPSVGFIIAAGWFILRGLEPLRAATGHGLRPIERAAWVIIILFIAGWGWESWTRNSVWRTPLTFWETAVTSSPEAGYPHEQLGIQYSRLGRLAEAEQAFRAAARRSTSPADRISLLSNLGDLYAKQGRHSEATAVLREALVQDRDNDEIHWHLSQLFFRMSIREGTYTLNGDRIADYDPSLFQEGEMHLKRALELRPMIKLFLEAGKIYMAFDRLGDAETYFRKVVEADPGSKSDVTAAARRRLTDLQTGANQ